MDEKQELGRLNKVHLICVQLAHNNELHSGDEGPSSIHNQWVDKDISIFVTIDRVIRMALDELVACYFKET